jgi:hypothetical protein
MTLASTFISPPQLLGPQSPVKSNNNNNVEGGIFRSITLLLI